MRTSSIIVLISLATDAVRPMPRTSPGGMIILMCAIGSTVIGIYRKLTSDTPNQRVGKITTAVPMTKLGRLIPAIARLRRK